jgi:hypothetical protein
MKKEVLELQIKTSQAIDEVEGLKKEIKKLQSEVLDNNEKTADSLKNIEGSSKSAAKGIKAIGLSIKAAGIGLLIAGFAKLKEVFEQNQTVADAFSDVMGTVSIVFNQVVDAVVKGSGEFNAFGKVLSGLVTIGLTPMKISFYGIKLGLQQAQLAWEDSFFGGKDQDKIKQLQADIKETKDNISGVATDAVNAGKDIYNNFSDAVDGISNISIKAAYEQAQLNTQLEKNAKLATVANQGLIEQYDREAELLRQLRDDTSKSIDERIKANEDLGLVLEKQQAAMQENAKTIVLAAQAQYEKNKNDENSIALQEALNEQAAIDAQITGFKSEQQTNLNSLLQEQKDIQNELALIGKTELETAKIEAEQKLQTQIDLITREVENEEERNALLLEAQRVYDEEVIALQAEFDAKEIEAAKIKSDEKQRLKDAELAQAQAVADAEAAIRDANLNNVAQGFALLGQLAGKNKALQALALLGESAAGIAKIIINTKAANAAATLKYAALPGGIALAKAEQTANNISAGIGIAATTAATAKGLSALKAGGSAPSANIGSEGGGARREAAAPSFNIVGQSGTNQLAESIGNQEKQPIKAYVVSNDVTTAQSMERNIVSSASI